MDWDEKVLMKMYNSIAKRRGEKEGNWDSNSTNRSVQFDLDSYKYAYFETMSLTEALSIVVNTLTRDSEFHLLGVDLEGLSSFFTTSFLHILPHKYHNLDHSINTLCFGDFILRILGGTYQTYIWDRLCFIIALCLHDIGHPGECNRGKIKDLSYLYGSVQPMTFEIIHAAIFRRIALDYGPVLFKGFSEVEIQEKLDFIEKIIFATDLKSNKEIISEFDSKYFEFTDESGVVGKKLKENVDIKICEIEFKMAVKLSDLSACYKDYSVFNMNSIAFWSEIHDSCGDNRSPGDILGDIYLLENISIPLADSFSLVFNDFRPLYDQALINLKQHRIYYENLSSKGMGERAACLNENIK